MFLIFLFIIINSVLFITFYTLGSCFRTLPVILLSDSFHHNKRHSFYNLLYIWILFQSVILISDLFIFFFPFCPQLSSGGLHTDLGALSVHIEESVAGLRDISGRHPLVVAVNVNVQAVLTIHQHPYPAPAPHRGQVTAVVLLHLHAKPSQGAGDASGKKKFWCVSAVHSQNIAGTHVGVLHNFQTSNLLTSRRRS